MNGNARIGHSRHGACFYDTNVIAAYMLSEEERAEKAEEALRACMERGLSVITIHELVYLATRKGLGGKLGEALMLIKSVFRIHGLGEKEALRAAGIRAEYRLPEVDSLILATAVENGYQVFYTFDSDFRKLNGLTLGGTRIVYLS